MRSWVEVRRVDAVALVREDPLDVVVVANRQLAEDLFVIQRRCTTLREGELRGVELVVRERALVVQRLELGQPLIGGGLGERLPAELPDPGGDQTGEEEDAPPRAQRMRRAPEDDQQVDDADARRDVPDLVVQHRGNPVPYRGR